MKQLIIVLLFFKVLSAQEYSVPLSILYSKEYKICVKNSIDSHSYNVCIENEYNHQDKLLNKAYKKAKGELQSFRHKALRNMQRKWIAYKDSKCGFFYHKESGSGGRTDSTFCQLNETILRTIELQELY